MLAVRPPEYFPPVATAALWLAAERVVVADTFAFSRQAAHNRARVRTAAGVQWLSVPRRHAPVGTRLDAVGVVDDGWARRHGHALRTAYGMAPFADHYLPEIAALLGAPHASLAALATATTEWTARQLGVSVVRASRLTGAPHTLADVWQAAGGGTVLALAASAARDAERLATQGATVRAFGLDEVATYRQTFPGFVPGLSALDLLMNHGPDAAAWLRAAGRVAP